MRPAHDESVLLQTLQGFTDRGSTDFEATREIALHQPDTRLEMSANDRRSEAKVNLIRDPTGTVTKRKAIPWGLRTRHRDSR
jgi:hypothetical protein